MNILFLNKKTCDLVRAAPNEEEAYRKRLIPSFKKIQFNSYWDLSELTAFLKLIMYHGEYQEKVDQEEIDIKIWQTHHYVYQDDIRKMICRYLLRKRKGQETEELPLIDLQDERFQNKFLTHLFKDHHCLIIETKLEKEEFTLDFSNSRMAARDSEIKGSCEYCNEKYLLAYFCVCGEVNRKSINFKNIFLLGNKIKIIYNHY